MLGIASLAVSQNDKFKDEEKWTKKNLLFYGRAVWFNAERFKLQQQRRRRKIQKEIRRKGVHFQCHNYNRCTQDEWTIQRKTKPKTMQKKNGEEEMYDERQQAKQLKTVQNWRQEKERKKIFDLPTLRKYTTTDELCI